MAQILIKNRDATGGPTDFQLDDVVMVAEDSHIWGTKELDPTRFRIVVQPGPRSNYLHLLSPEPASLRDVYPRTMVEVRRLQPAMRHAVRQAPDKTQRAYKADLLGNITRKPLEGR